ncbi:hypothetical protein HOLleu_33793 [Holothuria leucospilota]|uniref:Uncharacterized protein n=1 Tax=Holothuria leucospilota TaxID=206669 RepID=A0A9Q1BHY8_HOLLE|nr:hypothetical protein HOLleu_33793 [Holothuria leucospilota]
MGRKKTSKYNSLNFTSSKPDKNQPTISQSFNKAKEFNDKMDDSDEDVEIITSERSARVERRHKAMALENEEQENEAALLQQEEADLQRAIELSRLEACASGSQEWFTNDVVPDQSRETQINLEEPDEDALLGQEDDSSNEDKKSVKSEILLDSDNEEELPKERESEAEISYNSSRVSDGSSASATFPANHLQRKPPRKEEETLEVLEDVGEDFEEDLPKSGVDEAGSGREGRPSDEFNLSQDFLENQKTSRLSLRKRKRETDEASAPSKTLKVSTDLCEEDYEGETQPMLSNSQKEEDAKQEIENLVNGPFSLVQSEQLEERLPDNR